MKSSVVAVGILLASCSLVSAQAGSGSGSALPEKSGVAVNGGGAVVGTTQEGRTVVGPGHDASTQGSTTAGAAEKAGDSGPNGATKK